MSLTALLMKASIDENPGHPFLLPMYKRRTIAKRTKREIRTQEKKNESLEMKINELASLDKVIEVAQEEGLSYNNDNIKVIE